MFDVNRIQYLWELLRNNYKLAAFRELKNEREILENNIQDYYELLIKQIDITECGVMCCVCLEREIDCICLDCSHRCVCNICVENLTLCPICRKKIENTKPINSTINIEGYDGLAASLINFFSLHGNPLTSHLEEEN